jgi:hypothetical protein
MKTSLSFFVLTLLATAGFACGSSGATAPAAQPAGNDAGTADDSAPPPADIDAAPPPDYGKPSTTFPAFPPHFGQLANAGGYVMKNPIVVAVTWDTDTSQATFDKFADTVGGTAYWKAASSEYGVNAATSGATNHVHISTTPPAQVADADIQALVTANAGKTAGWPAPTQDTIYAFFLAPTTSLQVQSQLGGGAQDACKMGVGGYHDSVAADTGPTSYAVVPSCTFGAGNTAFEQSTMSMSHELLEAVTDPQPSTNSGYRSFGADYFAFDYFQELQSENGDACEFFRSSFYENKETTPATFDFWVQRTWSNAAGAAGHDPCVPAAAGPYFNVTPLALGAVNRTLPAILTGGSTQKDPTKGIHVTAGQSATFPIGFYSDADTGGPWTISVAAGNPLLNASAGGSIIDKYNGSSLTATVDKTSGQNGEKAYVTVTVKTAGSLFQGEIVTISSKKGNVTHYMPIWVSNE